MNLTYILAGGFLKGYRTVILAVTILLGLFGQYAVGDIDLIAFLKQDWAGILGAFGLLTAAAHKPTA